MTQKQKLTLASVMAKFNADLAKTAEETPQAAEVDTGDKNKSVKGDPQDAVEKEELKTKKAPGDTDDAAAQTAQKNLPGDTDDAAAKAETKTAGVKSLKEFAKTAAQNSEALMVKEAQEFGRLFAQTALEEMQKIAQAQEVFGSIVDEAYAATETGLLLTKVGEEAYMLTQDALASAAAYEKTAQVVSSHEKVAEGFDHGQDIKLATRLIKEAYDFTQQYIEAGADKGE